MTESSGLVQEVSILPPHRPRPLIIFIIGKMIRFKLRTLWFLWRSHWCLLCSVQNIILLPSGGPGSGKGSQAARLAHCFSLRVVSLDELLRRQLLSHASPGKKWEIVSEMMSHGELGPQVRVETP